MAVEEDVSAKCCDEDKSKEDKSPSVEEPKEPGDEVSGSGQHLESNSSSEKEDSPVATSSVKDVRKARLERLRALHLRRVSGAPYFVMLVTLGVVNTE